MRYCQEAEDFGHDTSKRGLLFIVSLRIWQTLILKSYIMTYKNMATVDDAKGRPSSHLASSAALSLCLCLFLVSWTPFASTAHSANVAMMSYLTSDTAGFSSEVLFSMYCVVLYLNSSKQGR